MRRVERVVPGLWTDLFPDPDPVAAASDVSETAKDGEKEKVAAREVEKEKT